MFKSIRAVLFDLFDTLLVKRNRDLGEKCMNNVYLFLVRSGIGISFEGFRKMYSEVLKEMYERIEKNLEEPHFSDKILQMLLKLGYNHNDAVPIAKGAAEAYMEELARHVYLDAEAVPVLRSLRESGYKTGIISNFSIPEGARKMIAAYGLENFLDIVIISGDVNRRKPSPEIFTIALNHLRVKPNEAVFIGDTPDTDIRGARKVGMKAILINRGNINIDSIEDKPDLVIRSLKEILRLLMD